MRVSRFIPDMYSFTDKYIFLESSIGMEMLKEMKNGIINAFSSSSKKQNIKQKYYWLITKFNEFCEENGCKAQKIALAVNGEPMLVAVDTIINNEVSHE